MAGLPALAQLFGIAPVPTVGGQSRALGTGNATPPTVDTAGVEPPSPAPDDPTQPGNVLAMLPSAQKARAQQAQGLPLGDTTGLGASLAVAADAGKGHSALGAFAAGFGKGLKASEDARSAANDKEGKAVKDRVDMLKTMFGIQKDQATTAETARHNQATEANSAQSTSNLGEYYKSIAENKADKTPGSSDISLGIQRAQTYSGYKPGDANFEALDPAVKNAARDRFGAAYKKIIGNDPEPGLLGNPYSSDSPTTAPATQSLWQRMFGSGTPAAPATTAPATPAPGTPPAPPVAAPTVPVAPTTAPAVPAKPDPAAVIQSARDAIARGAPADAVRAKMKAMGIDDSGL